MAPQRRALRLSEDKDTNASSLRAKGAVDLRPDSHEEDTRPVPDTCDSRWRPSQPAYLVQELRSETVFQVKEGRGCRTEGTSREPKDFGVNKGLSNLPLGIFLLFGDPRGGHQNFRVCTLAISIWMQPIYARSNFSWCNVGSPFTRTGRRRIASRSSRQRFCVDFKVLATSGFTRRITLLSPSTAFVIFCASCRISPMIVCTLFT